jgi:hypothetical protein
MDVADIKMGQFTFAATSYKKLWPKTFFLKTGFQEIPIWFFDIHIYPFEIKFVGPY